MRKFNRLIVIVVIFFIASMIGVNYIFSKIEENHKSLYRVEVNRLMNQLQDTKNFEKIDLRDYEIIKKIEFLSLSSSTEHAVMEFYLENNTLATMIQPWYETTELKGFVKFTYITEDVKEKNILILVEGSLFLFFIVIICILFYIKRNIIQPFHQLSDLPERLARGHFKGEVAVRKSRYFQNYLWGMGQLKDTLETTKKREYDLIKEKKQLLLSLSHDIKTPLNLIKLYGKALGDGLYDECEDERKKAICQIWKKSGEIEAYVNQIIKSSKEDVFEFKVEIMDFYLSEVMKNVFDVYREQCSKRNIELKIGQYQNRLLCGDLHRVQEVLENLFENAIKYGDGKRIEISFYEEDYCQLIKIFNTGVCVSDNEFNHLFDSFFRGSNAQGMQGSGLGLYICKELMRKMNGAIFAQKNEGGMAFVLVLH